MFHVGSRVWHEKPKENWKMHRPKCCEYNNKDEDNSPNTLNDKNYQASSQKFRQTILLIQNILLGTIYYQTLMHWNCIQIYEYVEVQK